MSTGVTTEVGRMVWHDLMSTDVEKAKRFYAELFGWELEIWKPGEMDYAMITAGGKMHGGFQSLDPAHGVPSHWVGYVLVDDLDGTVASAEQNGGAIHVQPTQIPEVGRFAVIGDPQGAIVCAFTPEGEAPTAAGTFVWDELLTDDVDGAKSFYGEVFGWTSADMDMGELGTYTMFKRAGGTDAAGLMKKPQGMPMPSMWLSYLATADIDATVKKAGELGASAVNPGMDIPNVGRIAILSDPAGALFGLFAPSQPAD